MTAPGEVLVQHFYLNLGRKCICGAITRTPAEWADHAEEQLHFANALDALELADVPIRRASDLLEEAATTARDASESANPNALIFAAGFMAGTIDRCIRMLRGIDD